MDLTTTATTSNFTVAPDPPPLPPRSMPSNGMKNLDFNCCMFKELHGLTNYQIERVEDVKPALIAWKQKLDWPYYMAHRTPYISVHCGIVQFTQAGHNPIYGHLTKAYIEQEGLGTVHELEVGTNPNTANPIILFLWTVDHAGFERWWHTNAPPADLPRPGEMFYRLTIRDGVNRWIVCRVGPDGKEVK